MIVHKEIVESSCDHCARGPVWTAVRYVDFSTTEFSGTSRSARARRRRRASNQTAANKAIATAAVRNLLGGEPMVRRSRHATIMADAAHAMLVRPVEWTGNCVIDEDLLAEEGVTDLSGYAVDPTQELQLDLFVEGPGAIGA